MQKISLFFLYLALILQLGHSLVPHIHIEPPQHGGKCHHHNDNEEDYWKNGLSHFFCHVNHNSDLFSNIQLDEVVK